VQRLLWWFGAHIEDGAAADQVMLAISVVGAISAGPRGSADNRKVVVGMPEWIICAATYAGVDSSGGRSCMG